MIALLVALSVTMPVTPPQWSPVTITEYGVGPWVKCSDGSRYSRHRTDMAATWLATMHSTIEVEYGGKRLTLKVCDRTANRSPFNRRIDLPDVLFEDPKLGFGIPASRGIAKARWRLLKK